MDLDLEDINVDEDLGTGAPMEEEEGEGEEVREEEDKESVAVLLEKLRQVVKSRLGTVEDVGAVGAVEDDDMERKNVESKSEGENQKRNFNVMVASARSMAQLNASTFDGEEGPGAARSAFKKTIGRIRELVVEPLKRQMAGLDKVAHKRLTEQLQTYGETCSRLRNISNRTKSLDEFAKIEQVERQLGIDAKFGVNSLCLPSKLHRLARDLGLDFDSEFPDESKVYLTYGVHLLMEIGYGADEVTLAASLTDDQSKETNLIDEAKDILDSFKLNDQDRGLEILHDKIRALMRRSDLEILLKAGSLHDLKGEVERVLSGMPQCSIARVARGLELTLPPLVVCKGFLHRGKRRMQVYNADDSSVIKQGIHDQQRVIASLTSLHGAGTPVEGDWKERTALMLTLEPPVEMGSNWANKIFSFSKIPNNLSNNGAGSAGVREGASLALLFAKSGHQPIESDALRNPPLLVTTAIVQHESVDSLRLLRINVENRESELGNIGSFDSQQNLATIINHISLRPDQHDDVPIIVGMIYQQVRFNALIASLVHSPRMELRRPTPNGLEAEGTGNDLKVGVKRPRLGSVSLDVPKKARQKRFLMCPARREHLLKFKKSNATNDLEEDDNDSEEEPGGGAGEKPDEMVESEHDVFVRIFPPERIEIFLGGNLLFTVAVGNFGEVQVTHGTGQPRVDLSLFVSKSNCLPLAISLSLDDLVQPS